VAINPDSALRTQARAQGWEVRDFRTGRKAAKLGVPAAAGAGAVAGGVVAGLALLRRHDGPPGPADVRRAGRWRASTGLRAATAR
jgi:hypothetical protein